MPRSSAACAIKAVSGRRASSTGLRATAARSRSPSGSTDPFMRATGRVVRARSPRADTPDDDACGATRDRCDDDLDRDRRAQSRLVEQPVRGCVVEVDRRSAPALDRGLPRVPRPAQQSPRQELRRPRPDGVHEQPSVVRLSSRSPLVGPRRSGSSGEVRPRRPRTRLRTAPLREPGVARAVQAVGAVHHAARLTMTTTMATFATRPPATIARIRGSVRLTFLSCRTRRRRRHRRYRHMLLTLRRRCERRVKMLWASARRSRATGGAGGSREPLLTRPNASARRRIARTARYAIAARIESSGPLSPTSRTSAIRRSSATAAGLSLDTSAVISVMPAARASARSSAVSAEPMPRRW
jgi:hypothetical protein